jgi:hypothetical protein
MKTSFYISALLFTTAFLSCRIDGEVGVGKVFILNSTTDTLKIEADYYSGDNNFCNSCPLFPQQQLLIASRGDIGAAPPPQSIIQTLRIYRNDSLKIESPAPFSVLQQTQEKGPKKYDTNYTIVITSADIH